MAVFIKTKMIGLALTGGSVGLGARKPQTTNPTSVASLAVRAAAVSISLTGTE